MKKKCLMLFMAIMLGSTLIGCGGKSEEPEPVKEEVKEKVKEEVVEEKVTLDQGYWIAESMVMEGTEFTNEEMTGIFGPADHVMALQFLPDEQVVDGIIFEDYFSGNYEGEAEKFSIALPDEKLTGTCSADGKMELTMQDGSKIFLTKQEEEPESIANNPWTTYDPNFTAEETCAMSNFINYGYYYVEDDVVYGLTHSGSLAGSFGAVSFHMKGDFPQFEGTKILDDRGVATYICKHEDYLYYIMNGEEICRIHPDGTGFESLFQGVVDYMQVHNERVYFANEEYQFVSTALDGSDLQTVVDKEVYYPYFIAEDWMIFQDDADGEALHLYNTTHGTELNITYEPSYNPIMDGNYLYYTDMYEDQYYLCQIDMSNPELFRSEDSENPLIDGVYMIDATHFYCYNNVNVEKANWKDLKAKDDTVTVQEMYVSKDYSIHHEYDAEGLISSKVLMSKEKFGGTSFK